jgi:hypothetical protein
MIDDLIYAHTMPDLGNPDKCGCYHVQSKQAEIGIAEPGEESGKVVSDGEGSVVRVCQ